MEEAPASEALAESVSEGVVEAQAEVSPEPVVVADEETGMEETSFEELFKLRPESFTPAAEDEVDKKDKKGKKGQKSV